MRIDIVTIFPEIFEIVLGTSIPGRAAEKGNAEFYVHNFRDWTLDNYRKVDDEPYGGGPGMLLKVDVMARCVRDVVEMAQPEGRLILTSPQGRPYRQADAAELAECERLVIIAGRYEGYDERIREVLRPVEFSVGDFVLSGGELPALCIIDSVVRLLPGVLGSAESLEHESFTDGLLDYPQYTRPVEFEGYRVPEVLLSGHHEEIRRWRERKALERTRRRRPDLLTREEDNEQAEID